MKIKELLKTVEGKIAVSSGAIMTALAVAPVACHAEATSLLDPAVATTLTGFADNLKPTVLALIAIIIPASLGIWAIGLGIKTGLNKLQKATKKAV